MSVQTVIIAKNARQGRLYLGFFDDLIQLGYQRQQVVAKVS